MTGENRYSCIRDNADAFSHLPHENREMIAEEEELAVPDPVNTKAADENGPAVAAAEKDVENSYGAVVEASKSSKKRAAATPKITRSLKRNKHNFDLSLMFEIFL